MRRREVNVYTTFLLIRNKSYLHNRGGLVELEKGVVDDK